MISNLYNYTHHSLYPSHSHHVASSDGFSAVSHLWDLKVFSGDILIGLFVSETGQWWSDVVSLSQLEILSEVLVSAPPVGPDHIQSLLSSNLMEVGISNVILLSLSWVSSVTVARGVSLVDFTNSISPVFNHSFLLYNNIKVNKSIIILLFLMAIQSTNDCAKCQISSVQMNLILFWEWNGWIFQ